MAVSSSKHRKVRCWGFGAYHTGTTSCLLKSYLTIFLVNRCLILYIWQCAHIVMYTKGADSRLVSSWVIYFHFFIYLLFYLRWKWPYGSVFLSTRIKKLAGGFWESCFLLWWKEISFTFTSCFLRTKIIRLWLSLCDTEAAWECKANLLAEQKGSKEQALVELPEQTWIHFLTVLLLNLINVL